MPNKATSRRSTLSPQTRRSSQGKSPGPIITSQSIASDLVAFRKQGGRIEILGNTPLRANVTAFSSRGNTQRKTAPVQPEKSASQG